MANKKELQLARPGNKKAAKTLKAYHRLSGKSVGMELAALYWLGFIMFVVSEGTTRIVMASVWAAITALLGATWYMPRRAKTAYNRLLAAGEIVVVDRRLVDIWDQLREEHNVTLSDSDRQREIDSLFYAAVDVKSDVENYVASVGNPELVEQETLAEARIRARLMRELTPLIMEQEARQQLIQPIVDWAAPGEVEVQMDILKARRAENKPGKACETVSGKKSTRKSVEQRNDQ